MENFKAKPKKGEWIVNNSISTDKHESAVTDGKNVIADVFRGSNAKLIAAAPDLLEALIEIREWYENNQSTLLGENTPICFSKGLSAIQKAIG